MRTIVFDLDGVLTQSPAAGTILDHEFFHRIWSNPDSQPCNAPLMEIARVLYRSGHYRFCILTARPVKYRDTTLQWLSLHGIDAVMGFVPIRTKPATLVMRTDTEDPRLLADSGRWKADTIKRWKNQGLEIDFVIEDYKPNAEQIRRVVPVLLFERVKP